MRKTTNRTKKWFKLEVVKLYNNSRYYYKPKFSVGELKIVFAYAYDISEARKILGLKKDEVLNYSQYDSRFDFDALAKRLEK